MKTARFSDVRGIYRWRSFADITPTGCVGVPAAATAAKGEQLFAAAAEGVADAMLATEEEWAHGSRVYPEVWTRWGF